MKPVIAVTGSGQKIRPPLATPALNTLMAQTELGSEISLLQQGLSYGSCLLFFLPSHPQSSSLLCEPFHPDKLEACVDFVAIAERSWQRCSNEMKQEFISQLHLLFLRLQGKIIWSSNLVLLKTRRHIQMEDWANWLFAHSLLFCQTLLTSLLLIRTR